MNRRADGKMENILFVSGQANRKGSTAVRLYRERFPK
ncbi:hypothetical protein AVEN_222961-1, partial [Araneus ventricosus]